MASSTTLPPTHPPPSPQSHPSRSPSFLLRLPSHDVLRALLTTYCNPVARAHLSLTCKALRAALVSSTPV